MNPFNSIVLKPSSGKLILFLGEQSLNFTKIYNNPFFNFQSVNRTEQNDTDITEKNIPEENLQLNSKITEPILGMFKIVFISPEIITVFCFAC